MWPLRFRSARWALGGLRSPLRSIQGWTYTIGREHARGIPLAHTISYYSSVIVVLLARISSWLLRVVMTIRLTWSPITLNIYFGAPRGYNSRNILRPAPLGAGCRALGAGARRPADLRGGGHDVRRDVGCGARSRYAHAGGRRPAGARAAAGPPPGRGVFDARFRTVWRFVQRHLVRFPAPPGPGGRSRRPPTS